jgi:hypothetical protein
MKNTIKQLIVVALVLSLASCGESFLDTNPKNSVNNDLAVSNYTNLVKAVNGLYAPLRASNYLGAYAMIAPDVMADNVKRSSVKNSSRYVQEFDLSVGPNVGYYGGLWTRPYYIINAANKIIISINNGGFDRESSTKAQIDQLLGEALFVRAMCHFDLCRLFAHHYQINDQAVAPNSDGQGGHLGVPIVTGSDIFALPARNTVKEVYAQVLKDLKDAETLITFENGVNKASLNAVKALLARVYLYMGDYTNAGLYAEQVINSGQYPLVEGADVVNYWTVEEGDETIFQLYSNSNEDYFPGNESLGSLYNLGAAFPYSDLIITQSLFDSYENGDARKNLYYTDANGEIRVKKFLPKEGYTSAYENNIKILRIAEMYLISAEAYLRTGSGNGANRLNELREARGLGSVALNQINLLAERRRELACEGQRLFDLARFGQNNNRPENAATPLVTYPDHRFILPIPQGEIDRNKNIVQNAGYNN